MDARPYNPRQVEQRWQKYWDGMNLFKCFSDAPEPKFYCLVMFPYPSGKLHVGHGRNYIIGDVVARYKLMRGFNVLAPMGWDAFGLPAENAAIKSNIHPATWVERNVETMKRQMRVLGIGYDWDREINTSSPDYYKWTQWVFLKLFERGLAYRSEAPVNWCDSCQTALANEEVVAGACERCGEAVGKRALNQWFFRITEYAQRLLEDLSLLEKWPERVRAMQANWIGRSEGAEVFFQIAETGDPLPCFTTRPDTLWGVTFMSIAPEHPLVEKLVDGTEFEKPVREFVRRVMRQSAIERSAEDVEKEGCFTGRHVINPVNGERVPLWVANYALMEYGTGAVMAVPAHDQRDFEFARKYDLPIKVVIQPEGQPLKPDAMHVAYVDPGVMVHSGPFDGVANLEGIPRVIDHLEEKDLGRRAVNYRIRDWLISRQRYWGAPIPVVHCEACGIVPVPEEQLPVRLPELEDFTPKGESPLATVPDFVNTSCPQCGEPARRETDTIAQWLCSCWYFLRYVSPHLEDAPFDRELVDRFLPVDQYIGGIEHAVLHLLYSRFIVKVLYDAAQVGFPEPFDALFTQGMICKRSYVCKRCHHVVTDDPSVSEPCRCETGMNVSTRIDREAEVTWRLEKMSKSKGNVVGFDDVLNQFGADTLRCYTLAIGPPQKDAEWQDSGIVGYYRFLSRLWQKTVENEENFRRIPKHVVRPDALSDTARDVYRKTHQTIRKVTDDIEGEWHFNTAIAAVMELLNAICKMPLLESYVGTETDQELADFNCFTFALESAVVLLAPFTPHVCEELWGVLGNPPSVFQQGWPEYDPEACVADTIEMAVTVNGKPRARITVPADRPDEDLIADALADDNVRKHTEGKQIVKTLVVPGRLVNIVVR
jgi:leucyl-tRNA synthetase